MEQLRSDSPQKNQNRQRTKSELLFGDDISLEDLTVMKLMEEIMELDQEIKLKEKFVKTRMAMLHKLLPNHSNKKTAIAAEDLLMKLQPQYAHANKSITHPTEAIPLGQANVYPDPIELKQKDVFDYPI